MASGGLSRAAREHTCGASSGLVRSRVPPCYSHVSPATPLPFLAPTALGLHHYYTPIQDWHLKNGVGETGQPHAKNETRPLPDTTRRDEPHRDGGSGRKARNRYAPRGKRRRWAPGGVAGILLEPDTEAEAARGAAAHPEPLGEGGRAGEQAARAWGPLRPPRGVWLEHMKDACSPAAEGTWPKFKKRVMDLSRSFFKKKD